MNHPAQQTSIPATRPEGPKATPPTLHHYRFAYELADGTTGTVTVKNPSMIAWDETRAARQWPDQGDAPNLWQTFVVWHALHRTGEYKDEFKKFRDDDCDALDMLNRQGESITAAAMQIALEKADQTGEPQAPEIRPEDAILPSDPTRTVAEPG